MNRADAAKIVAEGLMSTTKAGEEYRQQAAGWGRFAKDFADANDQDLADACLRAQVGCEAASEACRHIVDRIIAGMTGAGDA